MESNDLVFKAVYFEKPTKLIENQAGGINPYDSKKYLNNVVLPYYWNISLNIENNIKKFLQG